jgi:hypothetical protein
VIIAALAVWLASRLTQTPTTSRQTREDRSGIPPHGPHHSCPAGFPVMTSCVPGRLRPECDSPHMPRGRYTPAVSAPVTRVSIVGPNFLLTDQRSSISGCGIPLPAPRRRRCRNQSVVARRIIYAGQLQLRFGVVRRLALSRGSCTSSMSLIDTGSTASWLGRASPLTMSAPRRNRLSCAAATAPLRWTR